MACRIHRNNGLLTLRTTAWVWKRPHCRNLVSKRNASMKAARFMLSYWQNAESHMVIVARMDS